MGRRSAAYGVAVLLTAATFGSAAAQTAFTYDALGRVATATHPNGVVVTYSYDAAGNRIQRSAPIPDWTPLDLGSKLKAWWSAPVAGGNVTLNGSVVTAWTDEVGGYSLRQGTGTAQPIYSSTGFNGIPDVEFDGANDSLYLDGIPAGIPTGSTPSEIWAQARSDALSSDTTTDVLFDMGATASGAADRRTLARLSGSVAVVGDDGMIINGPLSSDGYHVWRGVFGATSGRLDMDGTQGSTTTGLTPTTGTARIRMGATDYSTSQGPWKGAVRQVIITEPLTDDEAALMYAYFNAAGGGGGSVTDGTVLLDSSTPGSFSYTVPAGVSYVDIEGWGGGASAGYFAAYNMYFGGGGGGYFKRHIAVTQGQVISGNIAAGGGTASTTVTSPALTATTPLPLNGQSGGQGGLGGTASGGDVNTSGNACCQVALTDGGGAGNGGGNQTTLNANGTPPGGGGAGNTGLGANGRIVITARTS